MLPICRTAISYRLRRRFYGRYWGSGSFDISMVINRLYNLGTGTWSSTDLEMVQQYSRIEICPDMYALKAYSWLVQEFRDSPTMIPHLRTLLREVPPHLIMPTAFDSEIVRVDRDWHVDDVEQALQRRLQTWNQRGFEYSDLNMRLLFFHNMWIQHHDLWIASLAFIPYSELISHLSWNGRRAPLTRILQLAAGTPDKQRLALGPDGYVTDIMGHDKIGPDWRVWYIITRCLPQSLETLATIYPANAEHREVLYEFLLWIHKGVVQNFDYKLASFTEAYAYIDAFDAFQIAHSLPMNDFVDIPGYFPISMDRLSLLLRGSSASTVTIGRDLLKEYERAWDTHKIHYKLRARLLLEYLTNYILASIPRDRWEGYVQDVTIPERTGRDLFENSTNDIPYILTCEEGLSLLKYSELSTEWADYDWDTLKAWRSALKCVAHINGLSLDYFTNPENVWWLSGHLSNGRVPDFTQLRWVSTGANP
ncbi:hypothetical protein V5O48_008582 [Marasmius crinis-equi]|uniref:Uncharacterized protein n=1 Tax=Marasmius crinis-equi TaxID=585013 RepID=A0ABR3FDL9_9AGAR